MNYIIFLFVAFVINAIAIYCLYIIDKHNNIKRINKNNQLELT